MSGFLAFSPACSPFSTPIFSIEVIILFAFGALVLLFYTWPLKHIALGELSIFLMWGPIMVSGVYLVLSKGLHTGFDLAGSAGRCTFRVERGEHQPG